MNPRVNSRLKTAVKRGLGACYRIVARPQPGMRVLVYHSVGDGGPRSQPRAAFLEQMQLLRDCAEVIPATQFTTSGVATGRRVLLTFDDGYRDAVDVVAPILQTFGFSAVFFVVTGLLDGRYSPSRARDYGLAPGLPLMTWDDAAALQRGGMSVGSHTHHHADLAHCNPARTRAEIADSVTAIRDRLHGEYVLFAYPWGQVRQLTKLSREALRENDVHMAFSTLVGSVTHESDPLALPRIVIDPRDSLLDFKAKLQGDWDYMRWIHRLPRRRRV